MMLYYEKMLKGGFHSSGEAFAQYDEKAEYALTANFYLIGELFYYEITEVILSYVVQTAQ